MSSSLQPNPQTLPSPTTTPPPPHPPPIIQALSYSPVKKPQPIPWSHEETLNLIKAYQEKWYSLKRGQLKASQWEEVSVTVAARCGLDEPCKSGTQCRHKIEKLRKRYRAEKQKLAPNYNYRNHPWIYFNLMNQLERGPLPITTVAPHNNNHHRVNINDDVADSDDEEEGGVRFVSLGKLGEASNGFLQIGAKVEDLGNGFRRRSDYEGRDARNSRNSKKRKSNWEGEEEEDEEHDFQELLMDGRDSRGNGSGLMGELAAQMREFAENFVRIERKKMELMRENQRLRMEMENNEREMILVYQHNTIELINEAFTDVSDNNLKMLTSNL